MNANAHSRATMSSGKFLGNQHKQEAEPQKSGGQQFMDGVQSRSSFNEPSFKSPGMDYSLA